MNDPAVKMAITISILVGGVFIAIVFQPFFSLHHGTMPELNTQLSVHHPRRLPLPTDPQVQSGVPLPFSAQKSAASAKSETFPTVLSPLGSPQSVPDLPSRYPSSTTANSARWGMPIDMMPAAARPMDGPKSHKIVDGDTLDDLAARYLGSARRATEIFQSNRDILSDPELLPIGVELKIPARGK